MWLSMGQHAGSAQLEAEQGLADSVEGSDMHRNVLLEFHCVSDFSCQTAVAVNFA